MSETVTVSSGITGTIYGTQAAGEAYIGGSYGATYTAWLALATAPRKQTLIAAARYLDRQSWADDYDTFAERDAVEAFQFASYELAVLIARDAAIVTKADQGNNIQSVGGGGAPSVTYFSPTSAARGSATVLPPVLHALIGSYLAATSSAVYGGSGLSGSDENPFDDCSDLDRSEPH
jgi:hypothetical protein